jgi:hypothetical protein
LATGIGREHFLVVVETVRQIGDLLARPASVALSLTVGPTGLGHD